MESRNLYFSSTYSIFHKCLTYHKNPVFFIFLAVDFIGIEAEQSKASQNIDSDVQQMRDLIPRKKIGCLNESCDITVEDFVLEASQSQLPVTPPGCPKQIPPKWTSYFSSCLFN